MNTYRATKYDSARDEVIALLSDEIEGYGERDDSTGEADAPGGYIQLVTIPEDVTFPAPAPMDYYSADRVANEYGVTPADVIGSHIVTHDSQGFVSVETFESEQEARAEFDCRAAHYAEWSEAQDDVENDPTGEDDGFRIYVCPVIGHGYHEV